MDVRNPATLDALLRGDIENAIIASTPGGIENQELEGGKAFRESDTLPIQCNGCTREQLEAIGIIFGETVDELFVHVQLPEGWKKIDVGHNYGYWTSLVDEKGRERAEIFYKAAFYDRRSYIRLIRRFTIYQYEDCDEHGSFVETETPTHTMTVINDSNFIMCHIGFVEAKDYLGMDILLKQAKEWLNTHYPEWENPTAYWD